MNLYKMIPKVDQILDNEIIKKLLEENSKNLIMESIHEELNSIRNNISNGCDEKVILNYIENLAKNIEKNLLNKKRLNLRKVINASGVVIHTNLGRSVLTDEILGNIKDVSVGYSNLEYDLQKGERGSRYSHLTKIIKRITGAEDCMVVNNNAAAVMLILSTMAKGRNVITSRSELVEIGGSFRIPDVCRESGAELKEVGTTNKTHLSDYENAIDENTAALFKVHQSNFKILGFTESVTSTELKDLKEKLGKIIVAYNRKGEPVTAKDLKAQGAMAALLKDAIKPNLVQTLEHTPAFIHGGPFANIAHGCNSIIATKLALKYADYVVTEAGFGADLGAEKFLDIKCRFAGLNPNAVVVVATVRALKMHGGLAKTELGNEDLVALEKGLPNLLKHVENMQNLFGIPCVVAINKFPLDTDAEIKLIETKCKELGVNPRHPWCRWRE